MDEHGLPIAFGKQSKNGALPAKPDTQSTTRGEGGGRGSRGAVGGGKRGRGRGRGGSGGYDIPRNFASGSNSIVGSGPRDFAQDNLNIGVKRPHPPSSPSDQPHSNSGSSVPPPHFRQFDQSRGRGGPRGRGGGGGGRGRGGLSGHGAGQGRENDQGYFKESFCEDPWKELLARRGLKG
ncbi:hypothetical protein CI109_102189 [Kwoniella shandongensis]|uniref:Uncharacterized protein n=1 Tax=Kwoniella shandongensis TaxID=1734106 RepID=A0A5M6BYR9_9TREE|nr:uncharacterized protein CI109_003653 [Kwoniella shandongensis]KAA5527998.1 hypothetical protein CI109_003653 [Kwoniella shandongensis]